MKLWIAAVAVSFLAATAGAQDIKIGYVDLQRALNESSAGQRAKESFKKEVDKLQAGLKRQKDELDSLKNQLEKKATVMKDEERRNLERDYQRKLRDFERAYKDSQGELQVRDNELTAEILRKLGEVIQDYGQANGYTLILENSSSTVLYSSENSDLTDRIIAEFNSKSR